MATIKIVDKEYRLNQRQLDFCVYYAETGNGEQSALRAGYAKKSATVQASELLTHDNIIRKIQSLTKAKHAGSIATGQQVMEFFTKVMNGEIKDQFGLEASLGDRTRAAQELAKRTVDLENRLAGKADAKVEIKLDWGDDE